MTQIFPVTTDTTLFSTDLGTIGITDPNVTGYHSLSTGWGETPVFVGSKVPIVGVSPYLPAQISLAFPDSPTFTFTSSENKLGKFIYPPVDFIGSLFSSFAWGLDPPTNIPVVYLAGSAGGQDSSVSGAEPYTYCYTWYSSLTGAESAPSPISAEIDSTLQSIGINTIAGTIPDLQYDSKRIYRKGGTQVSTFRLVTTIAYNVTSYVDVSSDDAISTSLALNDDNFKPFVTTALNGDTLYGTALPYIWGPFLGLYILACGDEVQPGNIFWTNAGRPDTMNPTNNLNITSSQEPLMNGFIYGANAFVFSQQRLFALDYGGPASIPTFAAREVPINMGLAAPFALTVSSLGGVFFLGNDGIYVTDCQGQIESITNDSLRPIFRGESTDEFPPVPFLDASGNPNKAIRLFASGQELHFIYPAPVSTELFTDYHLVYNILQKSWRRFTLGIEGHTVACGSPLGGSESAFLVGTNTSFGASDRRTLLLKYDNADFNNYKDGGTTPISGDAYSISATTGAFDMEIPATLKEYGNVIIDANPLGATISVTANFADGTSSLLGTMTGFTRQKFPFSLGDTYTYFTSFSFSWTSTSLTTQTGTSVPELYAIEILFRSDEEVLSHWETPPSAMGLSGWNHIRDGYICVRSTSDITFTINIDGTDYNYTIPSTSGERRKVYLQFNPIRGKMFGFSMNASGNGTFRLYGEDSFLNIKPWNTNVGYKPISPFTAAGYAEFLRKEGGT